MTKVWESRLPLMQKMVLLAMADHARDDGSKCFPSLEHLAWKCSLRRTQVKLYRARLRAKGILIKVRGGFRGQTAEYWIDEGKFPMDPERGADSDLFPPPKGVGKRHEKRSEVRPPIIRNRQGKRARSASIERERRARALPFHPLPPPKRTRGSRPACGKPQGPEQLEFFRRFEEVARKKSLD